MATEAYEGRDLPNPAEAVFDQGLNFDLGTLLSRRRALAVLGGGAAAAATAIAVLPKLASAQSCATIPEETAGPYPGDGSNGPNVLTASGVVRSDITSSFGSASGTASGAPLAITLQLTDTNNNCAPYGGAAVYLWHCDAEGRYSMYSNGVTDQNWLRGVQVADANGSVTFQSVFPGCYPGRWPHIHFEVYPSLDAAQSSANKIATSQVALPEAACTEVFGSTAGYESSVSNLARITLASDNVFGDDGGASQLGTMSGSIGSDLAVTLSVGVAGSSTTTPTVTTTPVPATTTTPTATAVPGATTTPEPTTSATPGATTTPDRNPNGRGRGRGRGPSRGGPQPGTGRTRRSRFGGSVR